MEAAADERNDSVAWTATGTADGEITSNFSWGFSRGNASVPSLPSIDTDRETDVRL
jgi:hypothetical protein